MGDPSKVAAQDEFGSVTEPSKTDGSKDSFEAQVGTAIGKMTQGEDGNWVVPNDLPENVAYATKLEKRRRDTQSELDKTRQSGKALEAENKKYRNRLTASVQLELSAEEQEELEGLKASDPDAWKEKLEEHETRAADKLQEDLDADSSDASEASEIERRGQVLKDFLDTNPELVLNDEVFNNDLPPRITGKLSEGKISFEDFLTEAKEFLEGTKSKIADGNKVEDEPDLNRTGGGSGVQDTVIEQDIKESYKDEVY